MSAWLRSNATSLALADQFARLLDERELEQESAAAKRHGAVRIQQPLPRTELAERNLAVKELVRSLKRARYAQVLPC